MKNVCIFLLILVISIPLVFSDDEDLGLPFYESGAEIVRHTGFVLTAGGTLIDTWAG